MSYRLKIGQPIRPEDEMNIYKIFTFIAIAIYQSNTAALEIEVLMHNGKPFHGALVSLHGQNLPQVDTQAIEIIQKDKHFTSKITATNVGSKVRFYNADTITHHVYSFSKPWKKQFRLAKNEEYLTTFSQAGDIILGCNIHDWMLAYVYVLDTPYYLFSDTKGLATFADTLDGNITSINIRHPRIREGRGKIEYKITNKDQHRLTIRLQKKLLPKRDQISEDNEEYTY